MQRAFANVDEMKALLVRLFYCEAIDTGRASLCLEGMFYGSSSFATTTRLRPMALA